jgi:tetratricopeptide (TPR) repeat protein
MRRGAVIAGSGFALLALGGGLSGCAAVGTAWRDRAEQRGAALASQSAESQNLSQEAQAAIDRHDDATALSLLQRLVGVAPRSAEAHHRLGRVLQSQGRLAEAGSSYRRALELDHEYAAAMIGLGTIDAALGRAGEALKRFDAAIELDPNHAEAHIARARTLEVVGRTDDALAAYFRALEFDPNARDARLRVATLQLDRNQTDQALARLDRLVEQNADDAEARYQRGRAHLALNHPALAADDLKFASGKLPDRPDVFYQLALALAAAHDTPGALSAAEHALKLAPGFTEARSLTERLRR